MRSNLQDPTPSHPWTLMNGHAGPIAIRSLGVCSANIERFASLRIAGYRPIAARYGHKTADKLHVESK